MAVPDSVEPGAEAFDERGAWQTDVAEWASPERSLERDEFWRALGDCLERLPTKLRTLFVLREFGGLETDQLLETLGLGTRNNAWVMLSRSRMRLRQCLQDSGFGWG